MNNLTVTADPHGHFPILILAKNCTHLETDFKASDNVVIDLTITSGTEGNTSTFYSGFCKIKLVDSYEIAMKNEAADEYQGIDDSTPVVLADPPIPYETQSQVWIDPSRSPFVYDNYDMTGSQGYYSVCHQSETSITVQQQNCLDVTKSLYNLTEDVHYPANDKKISQGQMNPQLTNHNESFYEDDELEVGVFLSKLPEEILNQKLNKAREDSKFIGMETDNLAVKQLMAPDIQTLSKQRKAILYLGPDAHCSQIIQQIASDDPNFQCFNAEVDNEVIIDDINPPPNSPKRYQCDKCDEIFDQISEFREHMIKHDKSAVLEAVRSRRAPSKQVFCDLDSLDAVYTCKPCGMNFKDKQKFEQHCSGHGDPNRECPKCNKVYVSKKNLRVHMKIHERKYPCRYCTRTYDNAEDMRAHAWKAHGIHMCQDCDFVTKKHSELYNHKKTHNPRFGNTDSSETDDVMMSNKMFLSNPSGHKKRYLKICNLCKKNFVRLSDVKRHLIEHVVENSLANAVVTTAGASHIQCEVCQKETFSKINEYKAHLREHANLTLYKCTFCNKTFSDASNFSKHKKTHGAALFQCVICHRKFNSKKMVARHMEYHKSNQPVNCTSCDKLFHFKSMLNKHIKRCNKKETTRRYRCKLCVKSFKSFKERWEHEWNVHSLRNHIADCLLCGAKFRIFLHLKQHCLEVHNLKLPTAKKLMKKQVSFVNYSKL